MLTAVYCGVPGSYAEEAAILYFGDGAQLITASSFQNAFDRLRDGEADRAVVPIENSSTGAIAAVYDLLGRYGFHIVGEQYVRVRHCLLAKKEAELSDIREVVSHEQGISSRWNFWGNIRSGCGGRSTTRRLRRRWPLKAKDSGWLPLPAGGRRNVTA